MAEIKLKNTTPGDGEVVILSNAKEYGDGWTGDDQYGETRHYPYGIWKRYVMTTIYGAPPRDSD